MSKVIIHIGSKVNDADPDEAKLKQANGLISQAKQLLGGPADGNGNARIRKAANTAWDGCHEALTALSGF